MSDYTNRAVVVGDPVLDGHGGISEFYAGVDYAGRPTGSLIAINRNGCFYLDAGGEWVERPELIFDIYGEYTREGEMIAETFGTFGLGAVVENAYRQRRRGTASAPCSAAPA
jgi:hypothetical protein